MKQRIGFIGLGTMGRPMAERLLQAGYELVVYNRTSQKTQPLLRRGALRVDAPRAVGETCDVVITVVSDTQALTDVVIGQQGLYMGLSRGKTHVDMSTISPALAQKLDRLCQAKEADFLHAPVLGSKPQAADGTLLIFAGGSRPAYERCQHVFQTLGQRIWHFPQAKQATHLKLICNQFIATMIMALSQGLVMGQKAGLDLDVILAVLEASALNAPMYQSKARMMRERRFAEANFYVTHLLKDINLMLEAGRDVGVPLPGLAAVRELFVAAEASGYGREDYSAVVKVLEGLAQTKVG